MDHQRVEQTALGDVPLDVCSRTVLTFAHELSRRESPHRPYHLSDELLTFEPLHVVQGLSEALYLFPGYRVED